MNFSKFFKCKNNSLKITTCKSLSNDHYNSLKIDDGVTCHIMIIIIFIIILNIISRFIKPESNT